MGGETFETSVDDERATPVVTPQNSPTLGTGVEQGRMSNQKVDSSLQFEKLDSNRLRIYMQRLQSIEELIATVNEYRKENTGIVGGTGDLLMNGVNWFGMNNTETGKSIYERHISLIGKKAQELGEMIVKENNNKKYSETDAQKIELLLEKIRKMCGIKLEKVSWGQAVFTSFGVGDVAGDNNSLENRIKIGARASLGAVEGVVDAVTGIAELTGKAIGLLAAYGNSDTRELVKQDISNIFSQLTLENAWKIYSLLPKAIDDFFRLPLDRQADGFGVFFGSFLVGAGIGVKVYQGGKHAIKLGGRAIRMAQHKGLSHSAPLAIAGGVQVAAGAVAMPVGVAVRAGEIDLIHGKKPGVSRNGSPGDKQVPFRGVDTEAMAHRRSDTVASNPHPTEGNTLSHTGELSPKKINTSLIDTDTYNQELQNLRDKRSSGELSQREYREGQIALIRERALQVTNQIFLEGEKILRSSPDIDPNELSKTLLSHFRQKNIHLSRLQEDMIMNTYRVFENALWERGNILKWHFEMARKKMPEKMEDIQKMINEDPEVNFQFFLNQFDSSKHKFDELRQLYSSIDPNNRPKIDLLSHPTVIIEDIPELFWTKGATTDGVFTPSKKTISVRRPATQDTIEHEYIHFLNSLVRDIVGNTHTSAAASSLWKTPGFKEKVTKRIGYDASGVQSIENGVRSEKDMVSKKMLWNNMQDELLAYIKSNNTTMVGLTSFMDAKQSRLFMEGRIPSHDIFDMITLRDFFSYSKEELHIPNEVLTEIIRTSGTGEVVYERLVKRFPKEFSGFPRTYGDHKQWYMSKIFDSTTERGVFAPGVQVIHNGGDDLILSGESHGVSFWMNSKIGAQFSDIDKLSTLVRNQGKWGIFDMPADVVDFLKSQNINIRTELPHGYTVVASWSANFFQIVKGGDHVTFSNLEEFIEKLKKFRDNPDQFFGTIQQKK